MYARKRARRKKVYNEKPVFDRELEIHNKAVKPFV